LTRELSLTEDQRARVEAIFSENRTRMSEAGSDDSAERRRQMERLRAESRQRIAELLTAEQRTRYEAISGGGTRGRGGGVSGARVWISDATEKNPRALAIRVGLTDGTFSEVVGGELKEGDEVILGVQSDAAKSRAPSAQQKAPRFGF
jgi:HlyD family secretion protein